FLLAAGLTIIFGLMDILNLAHGAFFTLGAYCGLIAAKATGSFWGAVVLGPLLPFAAGVLLQACILQPLAERGRSTHLDLALLTFGLLFATAGVLELVYGSAFYSIPIPPILSGHVLLFGVPYPAYRLFVIVLGMSLAIGLFVLMERTLVGATLRAGVADREMV